MVYVTPPSEARCPSRGGELLLRCVIGLRVTEYRARCRGCPWTGLLEWFWCDGCSRASFFTWTGGDWRCLRCGHIWDEGPTPRDLDRYRPEGPGRPDQA